MISHIQIFIKHISHIQTFIKSAIRSKRSNKKEVSKQKA